MKIFYLCRTLKEKVNRSKGITYVSDIFPVHQDEQVNGKRYPMHLHLIHNGINPNEKPFSYKGKLGVIRSIIDLKQKNKLKNDNKKEINI